MTILLLVVILVFLIVIHELGHFIAAKLFGVKVEEFGIGYPPRALRVGAIGDTEYTLNWIPFGGFVRLFGEQEDEGVHGKGSFVDAPRWKQGIILIAGVFMNAVAAWALFSGALMIGVPTVVDQLQPGTTAQLVVSDVVPASPADAAGIEPGDQIISMQDQSSDQPAALTPDAFVAFVSSHGGQPLALTYVREGATTTATVIPANSVVAANAGRPAIGIGLVLVADQSLPLQSAMHTALTVEIPNAFMLVGSGLWAIVKTSAHGTPDLSQVVGPVGLVSVVGQAAQQGWGDLFDLAAFISVNLTIVNLIPIPALDGGRLVVLIVEAIFRRNAPKLAIQLLNTVGIALIILLMVTVTYNDIARIVL